MLILDTDILQIVQRGRGPDYVRLADRLDSADDDVAVTIVSFEEQMRGWLAYIAQAKSDERQVQGYSRLRELMDDFQTRPVLDYNAAAAAEFRRLRKSRVRIGSMDLKIAAIARIHDAMLISRNLVDFRKVPGLRVEDWTTIASP